jgi:hypothetical protein
MCEPFSDAEKRTPAYTRLLRAYQRAESKYHAAANPLKRVQQYSNAPEASSAPYTCTQTKPGQAGTWTAELVLKPGKTEWRVTGVHLYEKAAASTLKGAIVKVGNTVCGTIAENSYSRWHSVLCSSVISGTSVTVSHPQSELNFCGIKVFGYESDALSHEFRKHGEGVTMDTAGNIYGLYKDGSIYKHGASAVALSAPTESRKVGGGAKAISAGHNLWKIDRHSARVHRYSDAGQWEEKGTASMLYQSIAA